MQDDPGSTSHSPGRPSTGPHARTHEATRTVPRCESTLRRVERASVQGSVRRPKKDEMNTCTHRARKVSSLSALPPPLPLHTDHCWSTTAALPSSHSVETANAPPALPTLDPEGP